MGTCELDIEGSFFKVGDRIILIEKVDAFDNLEGQGWSFVRLSQVRKKDYDCFVDKDEIENAKQLQTWMDEKKSDFFCGFSALDFEQSICGYLEDVLYCNFSINELPKRKANKIINDLIKKFKEEEI